MALSRESVQVEGIDPLLRKLSRLPAEVQAGADDAAEAIAADEATRIEAASRSAGRRAALAGRSVRARAGSSPAVVAGGSARLPNGTGTFGDLFFGAEFGGGARKTTQQFAPHKGRVGYWFWPQLRSDEDRMAAEWSAVIDTVVRNWEGT